MSNNKPKNTPSNGSQGQSAKVTADLAAQAAVENSQDDGPSGDWVVISTNHRQQRRRAGMRFTPEGVKVDAAKLTEKQREAIKSDPHLVVKPFSDEAGD